MQWEDGEERRRARGRHALVHSWWVAWPMKRSNRGDRVRPAATSRYRSRRSGPRRQAGQREVEGPGLERSHPGSDIQAMAPSMATSRCRFNVLALSTNVDALTRGVVPVARIPPRDKRSGAPSSLSARLSRRVASGGSRSRGDKATRWRTTTRRRSLARRWARPLNMGGLAAEM